VFSSGTETNEVSTRQRKREERKSRDLHPDVVVDTHGGVAHPRGSDDLDALCINTIRALAMDAVQAADSGHPGTRFAPVAYVLWKRFLKFDPTEPDWPDPIGSCWPSTGIAYTRRGVRGGGRAAGNSTRPPPLGSRLARAHDLEHRPRHPARPEDLRGHDVDLPLLILAEALHEVAERVGPVDEQFMDRP
jgi:hypothetical protein